MPQFYDNTVAAPPPVADETLIAKALGGDRRAFGLLVERHYDFIFRTACKWCGKVSDAEDVAQDVWLQLTRLDKLDEIEQIGNWLFTAARNRVVNVYKKRKNVPFSQLENHRTPDDDDDGGLADDLFFDQWPDDEMPDAALETDEFWAIFNTALDRLPPDQRDVFVANELDGLSFREISELTGTNINTLMARKRYAVQRLQKELSPF